MRRELVLSMAFRALFSKLLPFEDTEALHLKTKGTTSDVQVKQHSARTDMTHDVHDMMLCYSRRSAAQRAQLIVPSSSVCLPQWHKKKKKVQRNAHKGHCAELSFCVKNFEECHWVEMRQCQ